jgi:photosystem II stability/assembly factor-like uncharacterized protein
LWADGSVIGLDQNAQRIWHTTSGTSDFISAVTYDTHGKQALLATARGKVLRSRDGGHTWKSAMVVDNTYLSGIYADPQSGAITTVGSRATVARSRDGGTNWELLHGNAWTSRLAALSVDANGDNLLAAGSGGLMLRSTDRGLTWTETHADLLAVPGSKALVAVGNDGLLLRSTDTGRNWSVIAMSTSKPLPAPVSLQSLIYEPHSAALIAAGPVGTILRSQDTGLTWQAIQPIPDAGEGFLRQVVADPDTGVLVAVGDIGGVMRSIDSGRTWIKSEAPAGKTVDQVVALGQGVFVAIATNTPNAVMLRSTDGGSHWQSVDAALKGSLTGLYAEPQNKVVWVMGQGIQMGSHDAGASWTQTQVPAEVNMSFMLRTATKTLLAFGKGGVILRSTNDGSTWQVIPGPNTSSLRKPLIDAKTQAIYVPGRDGTLLRSKDDGKSWEILPLHTNAHVNRLVLDDTTRTLILTGERIIRVVLPD